MEGFRWIFGNPLTDLGNLQKFIPPVSCVRKACQPTGKIGVAVSKSDNSIRFQFHGLVKHQLFVLFLRRLAIGDFTYLVFDIGNNP